MLTKAEAEFVLFTTTLIVSANGAKHVVFTLLAESVVIVKFVPGVDWKSLSLITTTALPEVTVFVKLFVWKFNCAGSAPISCKITALVRGLGPVNCKWFVINSVFVEFLNAV